MWSKMSAGTVSEARIIWCKNHFHNKVLTEHDWWDWCFLLLSLLEKWHTQGFLGASRSNKQIKTNFPLKMLLWNMTPHAISYLTSNGSKNFKKSVRKPIFIGCDIKTTKQRTETNQCSACLDYI